MQGEGAEFPGKVNAGSHLVSLLSGSGVEFLALSASWRGLFGLGLVGSVFLPDLGLYHNTMAFMCTANAGRNCKIVLARNLAKCWF